MGHGDLHGKIIERNNEGEFLHHRCMAGASRKHFNTSVWKCLIICHLAVLACIKTSYEYFCPLCKKNVIKIFHLLKCFSAKGKKRSGEVGGEGWESSCMGKTASVQRMGPFLSILKSNHMSQTKLHPLSTPPSV